MCESRFDIPFIKNFLNEVHPNSELLSDKYERAYDKLTWKCAKGHIWDATWRKIYYCENWCPYCAGKAKWTLERIIIWVNENHPEGECLSTEYINNKAYMQWKCKFGHIWKAKWGDIHNDNNWCPECSPLKKHDLIIIKNYLDKEHPGGECLSEKYNGAGEKMTWKCKFGHVWNTSWNEIHSRERWCPVCTIGFGERCCRYVFSLLFGIDFVKIKPWWLQQKENDKRTRLELDGYCEPLNLAFEYQGAQHNEIVQKFRGTEESLMRQKLRDNIKRQKCKERGVVLLEIPQFDRRFHKSQLKSYIKNLLIENNFEIPIDFDNIELDFRNI